MIQDSLCAAVIGGAGGRSADTLAVVSDRRLSVAALAALLLNDPELTVIRTGRGPSEVESLLSESLPAVVVIDGFWPEDLPRALQVNRWGGRTLLLLDPVDDAAVYLRAVGSGAHGYLSRTASRGALRSAIDSVRATGYYLDPLLAARILSASEVSRKVPQPVEPQLSLRELEILARIASGRSSKEIAREYAVTSKTICNHVSNIYAKLRFTHRGQLVLYAAEHGLAAI